MRHRYHRRAFVQQCVDCRHGPAYPPVIFYRAGLLVQRHVEIHADEDALAGSINIVNRRFHLVSRDAKSSEWSAKRVTSPPYTSANPRIGSSSPTRCRTSSPV